MSGAPISVILTIFTLDGSTVNHDSVRRTIGAATTPLEMSHFAYSSIQLHSSVCASLLPHCFRPLKLRRQCFPTRLPPCRSSTSTYSHALVYLQVKPLSSQNRFRRCSGSLKGFSWLKGTPLTGSSGGPSLGCGCSRCSMCRRGSTSNARQGCAICGAREFRFDSHDTATARHCSLRWKRCRKC